MQKLKKIRLQQVLTEKLGLDKPEFHLESNGSRWFGSVVSSTFQERRDSERQQLIWDALDEELGANAATQVGMLLAFTPQEWHFNDELVSPPRRKAKAG